MKNKKRKIINSSNNKTITDLCADVLSEITNYFSVSEEQFSFKLTCQYFYKIISSPRFSCCINIVYKCIRIDLILSLKPPLSFPPKNNMFIHKLHINENLLSFLCHINKPTYTFKKLKTLYLEFESYKNYQKGFKLISNISLYPLVSELIILPDTTNGICMEYQEKKKFKEFFNHSIFQRLKYLDISQLHFFFRTAFYRFKYLYLNEMRNITNGSIETLKKQCEYMKTLIKICNCDWCNENYTSIEIDKIRLFTSHGCTFFVLKKQKKIIIECKNHQCCFKCDKRNSLVDAVRMFSHLIPEMGYCTICKKYYCEWEYMELNCWKGSNDSGRCVTCMNKWCGNCGSAYICNKCDNKYCSKLECQEFHHVKCNGIIIYKK